MSYFQDAKWFQPLDTSRKHDRLQDVFDRLSSDPFERLENEISSWNDVLKIVKIVLKIEYRLENFKKQVSWKLEKSSWKKNIVLKIFKIPFQDTLSRRISCVLKIEIGVLKGCPDRVSWQGVLKGCLERVSWKGVLKGCLEKPSRRRFKTPYQDAP